MKPKIRITSFLLALCLVVGLLPATAFAVGTDTGKAIQLVDSGTAANISGGQADSVYFGTYQQSSNGSGGYHTDPIKWRVLENADSKLFLLSDQNLDVFEYHKENESVTWETSTMRSWLNGLAENQGSGDNAIDYKDNNFLGNAFSAKEQTAIADTKVDNDTTDKIFLLSKTEANNTAYFADKNSRIATNTAYVAGGGEIHTSSMHRAGSADVWWLRSPGAIANYAVFVFDNGYVYNNGESVSYVKNAVRPAFNLDLNSVLFTSAAVGGKPDGGLTAVPEYSGNEWKLTLLDNSRNFAVTETTASGKPGDTITLNYTGATVGANEYISVIITDSSGNATHYGRIAQPTAENGTVDITIPSGLATGSYTLKVFSEQCNGDKKTDYASDFENINLTVGHQEQFSLTPGSTYWFDLSGTEIPGTKNGDLPDGSLHWVPFTYVGTINAYKLESAQVTTEDYAWENAYDHSLFIADYVVTRSVRWHELNNKSLIFGTPYTSYGVSYTLRAPSAGSYYTGSGESKRGTPRSNEWDKILNKDSGYIKNWSGVLSWGQDNHPLEGQRAIRGAASARYWSNSHAATYPPNVGFRPVFELPAPDALSSDSLKVVTLNLNGGKLGKSTDAIQIIVKTGSEFTAPASNGMTRPSGATGNYFMWLDGNGNSYAPGDSVPADVTELTVQWTAPIYTVTLNTNGGTINSGNVTEYTYGTGATLPNADDMTYTGYTFKGWYDNDGLTGDPVMTIGDTEAGNKEYWAK